MPFQPDVDQELVIDQIAYRVTEHPAAPGSGMPYGQEGRAGAVFQLVNDAGDLCALKVFKPRYRRPALVGLSRKLAAWADLPGLIVCRRLALTPEQHDELLRAQPDLLYAALMPWIAGRTWNEIMQERQPLSVEQSLALARAFLNVLARLEQEGVAHGDLSAANLLINGLESGVPRVELVDVEQLYAPGLIKPVDLPTSSPGYGHSKAGSVAWEPEMDRFSGAVLLAEMLGWSDDRVCQAAAGESYFAEDELQMDGQRYDLLRAVLADRWGDGAASLLDEVWRSNSPAECPLFGVWKLALPAPEPVIDTAPPPSLGPEPSPDDLLKQEFIKAAATESQARSWIAPARSPRRWLVSAAAILVLALFGLLAWLFITPPSPTTVVGQSSPSGEDDLSTAVAGTAAALGLEAEQTRAGLAATVEALGTQLAAVLAITPENGPTATAVAVIQTAAAESVIEVVAQLTQVATRTTPPRVMPGSVNQGGGAVVQIGRTGSRPALLNPVGSCSAGSALPHFAPDGAIEFRWWWDETFAGDNYLEVRAGEAGGQLAALGRADPNNREANGDWLFTAPVRQFYRPGRQTYAWQVVYTAPDSRVMTVSDIQCFSIQVAEERSSNLAQPAQDRDKDNYYDHEDDCPDVPAGDHPDPARPGCPAEDDDLDGWYNHEDLCRDVPAGDHPDPARPGCPMGGGTCPDGSDEDGDQVCFPHEDQCPHSPASAYPDPDRPGCPADSDGDGYPDYIDQCKSADGRINPDPNRPGCSLPTVVPDSDGDGYPDDIDQCNGEDGRIDPDPNRPGCSLPTVVPDSDGDGYPDDIDQCNGEDGRIDPDPNRPGCSLPEPPPGPLTIPLVLAISGLVYGLNLKNRPRTGSA